MNSLVVVVITLFSYWGLGWIMWTAAMSRALVLDILYHLLACTASAYRAMEIEMEEKKMTKTERHMEICEE